MSKFWIGAGTVLVLGMAAVLLAGSGSDLEVNDLETECRGDRHTRVNIDLSAGNRLSFEGYFPVKNVNSDLSYSYSGGNNIVLNIKSENLGAPETFWNDCLASAVYDLEAGKLEPGRYSVEVRHNGERVEKRILRVK